MGTTGKTNTFFLNKAFSITHATKHQIAVLKVVAVIAWGGKELSLAEFKELAKQKVAPYAIPTVLKTMKELPRNHLGKVNKKELVKIFDS
jgi:non-ribosomal peptide synthetase component E (peptide arylation enzyme)